jgi:hypothetical protein
MKKEALNISSMKEAKQLNSNKNKEASMNTEAIKKSKLNENKINKKSFDLIMEKDDYSNEYAIFPQG